MIVTEHVLQRVARFILSFLKGVGECSGSAQFRPLFAP